VARSGREKYFVRIKTRPDQTTGEII